MIPRNPSQSPDPKRLGFSSAFNRTSYLSNPASSIRASVSNSISSNLDAIVTFAMQRFVTRAESESRGGEVVEDTENVGEEVVEEGSEEDEVKNEVEVAVKEPRKPLVKLGEIIGVFTVFAFAF